MKDLFGKIVSEVGKVGEAGLSALEQQQAIELDRAARAALDAGDLAGAQRLWEEAATFDPDNAQVQRRLASLQRPELRRSAAPVTHRDEPPRPAPRSSRNHVFISYARGDRKWLEELRPHLKPFERSHSVKIWDDSEIEPGAEWHDAIGSATRASRVGILLVSARFFASDFIHGNELPAMLRMSASGGLLLPLLVSASRYEDHPELSRVQSVNPPGEYLANIDEGAREKFYDLTADRLRTALRSS